jgi:hypothetical protein
MIALRLVRLIENHSDELAQGLIEKFEKSPRTSEMKRVPHEELRNRVDELLHQLGEWLLTKTENDVERRYAEIGRRRASQGVSLSHYCWAIVLTKEHIWDFLQQHAFLTNPIEIYGEMELLRLLDQFFDRAMCYAAEGYERQEEQLVEAAVHHKARAGG